MALMLMRYAAPNVVLPWCFNQGEHNVRQAMSISDATKIAEGGVSYSAVVAIGEGNRSQPFIVVNGLHLHRSGARDPGRRQTG